jgi:hypothetical protein
MQTYSEKSTQLALDASVAVLVLMGAHDDVEFIPLKPRMIDENMSAELKARWPGRGLRSVGMLGLCGTSPRCALKEPLEPEQVSALMGAFLAYCHALFCGRFNTQQDRFAAQMETADIAELERLYLLPDTRMN